MGKNIIYYCSKCNSAYGGQLGTMQRCPDCQNLLFETKTEREEWRKLTDIQKNDLKLQWKLEADRMNNVINHRNTITDIQSILDINPLYEYDVVVIEDDDLGFMDIQKLKDTLAKYASLGWRLKSIINNELGQNTLSIASIGTNHTIEQHVLIFERLIQTAKK